MTWRHTNPCRFVIAPGDDNSIRARVSEWVRGWGLENECRRSWWPRATRCNNNIENFVELRVDRTRSRNATCHSSRKRESGLFRCSDHESFSGTDICVRLQASFRMRAFSMKNDRIAPAVPLFRVREPDGRPRTDGPPPYLGRGERVPLTNEWFECVEVNRLKVTNNEKSIQREKTS